ncbi:MAG: hypothetical protein ACP5XB_19175 [Isosphaeraceae bacterium]
MSDEVLRTQTGPLEFNRREALGSLAVGLTWGAAAGRAAGLDPPARPRIAAVVTEYRKASHGEGIVDRFLDGYGRNGRHYLPKVEVVSLYVDQKPKGDLSAERCARHKGLKLYPTIAEALTCGGKTLAVDGVLSIGEHGRYPRNSRGQTLYPRFEFFQQIVEVFRKSGKCVPVFNDKHLSWNWDWAKTMVDTAHELGFPFMAGSSLPVTWRIPAIDVPLGADLDEVVSVGYGGVDSYDFHGLETLQCMAERRRGGETGVAAVRALRGASVWKALAKGCWDSGGCSRRLLEACLCRSFTLGSPRKGYGHALPDLAQMPRLARDPVLYRIEYVDGLKGTLLMLSGLVGDFTVAVATKGRDQVLSTQMYLPGLHPGQTLPNFFSALARNVEAMFLSGKPTYPVERTLLTTGILASAIDSLTRDQKRIETPHLRKIAYQSTRESTFLRS